MAIAAVWGGQSWPQPPFRRPIERFTNLKSRLKAGCGQDCPMPLSFPTRGHLRKRWGGPAVRRQPSGRRVRALAFTAKRDVGVPRRPEGPAPPKLCQTEFLCR